MKKIVNKFKKGDKVEYLNLKSKKIKASVIAYETVRTTICNVKTESLCVKLSNGELVHDRHLRKL